jgi:immune inhibitor A
VNQSLVVLIVVCVVLAAASCWCCGNVGWDAFPSPTPAAETSEPAPVITRAPPGEVGAETERLLATTVVPERDLRALAIRLRGISPDTPTTINPQGSPDYPVGTRRLFHVSNVDTDERFDIYAILEYKTEHVYMWVEEGVHFDQDDVAAAAVFFEEHTYVTDRAFFGSEWSPGVDNDPHISILHARNLGSWVLGLFGSGDEFVSDVRSDSNQMEMFYVNADWLEIGTEEYHCTLAHEFQHMIHWYHDRNEDTWINEGFSELACPLNGFQASGHEWSFASQPDNQLNQIDYEAADSSASYGASYLFTAYFLDRFGTEATRALVARPENSFAGVDAALEELGTGLTHADVFGDWVVANLLDDPSIADGYYGYEDIDLPSFEVGFGYMESDYPIAKSATVHQYGADYIGLSDDQPLSFRFAGSTQVGLIDASAHSGRYVWWSNRGDDSDMTLTRAFDLSAVDSATLEFWAWYDIEANWDYAYVETSTDGGLTWTILTTSSCTTVDPNGSSFGCAYTSKSGGGAGPEWIRQHVDLSAYAGQEVLIRFEYITDDAVNQPGFAVDDVAIPEIGYASDFEADDGGWEPAGFMRHANVLPQRWLVQLILFGPETTVQRLKLDQDQAGEWVIPLSGGADRAVVAISGLAPVTTEVASYSYEVAVQR